MPSDFHRSRCASKRLSTVAQSQIARSVACTSGRAAQALNESNAADSARIAGDSVSVRSPTDSRESGNSASATTARQSPTVRFDGEDLSDWFIRLSLRRARIGSVSGYCWVAPKRAYQRIARLRNVHMQARAWASVRPGTTAPSSRSGRNASAHPHGRWSIAPNVWCIPSSGSLCKLVAHLGEAQGEVRLRQLRDHVPLERLVVRDRSLAIGRPEQDRQRELCRSGAAVPPKPNPVGECRPPAR